MVAQRRKPVLYAVDALLIVWLIAFLGYSIAAHYKVTTEKVAAYLRANNLSKLSPTEREKALRELARKMNALSAEDRRKARLDGQFAPWFQEMTDEEKGRFIDETMPSGFKQMLVSFEQLPVEKRKKTIDDALRNMRKTRDQADTQDGTPGEIGSQTNRMGELSPDLQKKVVQIGLKSFYSESSAQTKAELAPVMEEMQRLMESGRLFRNRPQ